MLLKFNSAPRCLSWELFNEKIHRVNAFIMNNTFKNPIFMALKVNKISFRKDELRGY